MNSSIVVSGIDATRIEITPQFTSLKRAAVEEAQLCQAVNDPFTQGAATESLRALVRIQKQVEDDRQLVKKPVLDLGRQIDGTAQTFLSDVNSEVVRLKGLLSSYEIEQRKKAEAERQRQIEQQRKAQEAERVRLVELDRQRRETEEAARKAQQASTPQEATRALQAAVVAEEKAEALAAPVAQPVFTAPVVHRAEGAVVQERWTFDLVDIHALYAARPDLVQLTPRTSVILTAIRAGLLEIPGINIRKEINVGVRV